MHCPLRGVKALCSVARRAPDGASSTAGRNRSPAWSRLRRPLQAAPCRTSRAGWGLSLAGPRHRARKRGAGTGNGMGPSSGRQAASEESRAWQLEAREAKPRCSGSRALHRSWTPRRWNGRCARMWSRPYGTSSSTWPYCESVSVLLGCGHETRGELADTTHPALVLWGPASWASWAVARRVGHVGRDQRAQARLRVCGLGSEVHALARTARAIASPALRAFELKEPQGFIPPSPPELRPSFCRQKLRARVEKWLAQGHAAVQWTILI